MDIFSRKAILGIAAALTAATAASMSAGAAMAAPAAPAAPAARVAAALPTTTCNFSAVLSWPLTVQGNTGERVRTIQYNLNAQIGAGLQADGIFGPLTRNAVARFQQICGIGVDGKVGNQTWPRLLRQIQQGNTGQGVVALQHSLRFVFGYPIAVDGIFGPQTRAAVVNFQFHHGLVQDGIVGTRTWNAIVRNEP
jgi:peptidoglycan hydrolase-like protein with peptidoglycan-binding domain